MPNPTPSPKHTRPLPPNPHRHLYDTFFWAHKINPVKHAFHFLPNGSRLEATWAQAGLSELSKDKRERNMDELPGFSHYMDFPPPHLSEFTAVTAAAEACNPNALSALYRRQSTLPSK